MLRSFIEHFAYTGLFLALFGGAVGLPIPEGVPLVAGGVLAHQAVIRWWIALPVCMAAAVTGDAALYWTGHHWGECVLEWRLVRRVFSAERQAKLLAIYHRNGVKVVFVGRHVMGIRTAVSLIAGIAGIPFWKFLTIQLAVTGASIPVAFGLAFLFTDPRWW
jgi:membrane protein DedA with SNARE-associated domain